MPEQTHENWERAEGLTFEVGEIEEGWIIWLNSKHARHPWSIGVTFATHEAATKVGQAILDYAYGPAGIDLSKVKIKPQEADEKKKKPTRKAPRKKRSESAATASPARIEQ